jgi:hypothetical protein
LHLFIWLGVPIKIPFFWNFLICKPHNIWIKSERILMVAKLASPTHSVPTTPGFYRTIWRLVTLKKRKDTDADVSAGEVIVVKSADPTGSTHEGIGLFSTGPLMATGT